MKSSNHRAWNIKPVARTVVVLVLAVIMVGMSITPVLARDDRGRHGPKRYYGPRGYHGPKRYYGPRGYYYPAPVYAPPPVVYAPPPPTVVYAPPPPPPGISIVFPIHIR